MPDTHGAGYGIRTTRDAGYAGVVKTPESVLAIKVLALGASFANLILIFSSRGVSRIPLVLS